MSFYNGDFVVIGIHFLTFWASQVYCTFVLGAPNDGGKVTKHQSDIHLQAAAASGSPASKPIGKLIPSQTALFVCDIQVLQRQWKIEGCFLVVLLVLLQTALCHLVVSQNDSDCFPGIVFGNAHGLFKN